VILLVIYDEHKAIIGAFRNRLGVEHQHSFFHKMKNVQVKVTSWDSKTFMADFRDIFWAESRETAMKTAGRLQAQWKWQGRFQENLKNKGGTANLEKDSDPMIWLANHVTTRLSYIGSLIFC
jgi:transposase-like protein